MAEEQDPLIGVMVRDYVLVRLLGRGAMGLVYLAQHCATKKEVAIKFLSGEFSSKKEFVSRFMNEAASCAALEHANIVRVFEAGQDDGTYFMVMEFVDGVDLAHYLEVQDKLKERQVLPWLKQSAIALGYAHSQGIVHRDLKPENIMVTKAGEIKVADLGLSKNLGMDQDFSMTMSGTVIGTPYYISPEQARDAKHVDPRTDMYSLGATFYHLVTGYPPFQGSSAAEVMAKHMNEQLPYPQRKNTALSDGLSDVIMKMMEKDPGRRFQTMQELAEAVDRLERGESGIVKKIKLRQTESMVEVASQSPWKSPARIASLAVAAVVALLVAWWVLKPSKPAPSTTVVTDHPGNTGTNLTPVVPDHPGNTDTNLTPVVTDHPGDTETNLTPVVTDHPGNTETNLTPVVADHPGNTVTNTVSTGTNITSVVPRPAHPPKPPDHTLDPEDNGGGLTIKGTGGSSSGSRTPEVSLSFNWVDGFVILAIMAGVLSTTPIGWFWGSLRAAGMWLAVMVVFWWFDDIAQWLHTNAAVPEGTAVTLAFIFFSLVMMMTAWIATHRLIGHQKQTWQVKLNRTLAIVPGIVLGGAFGAWMIAMLAVFASSTFPIPGSWIGSRVLKNFPAVQKAAELQLKESQTPAK